MLLLEFLVYHIPQTAKPNLPYFEINHKFKLFQSCPENLPRNLTVQVAGCVNRRDFKDLKSELSEQNNRRQLTQTDPILPLLNDSGGRGSGKGSKLLQKDCNHWRLQIWFWMDQWILIKHQDAFPLSCSFLRFSVQKKPLGPVPNPNEACHQFNKLSMTLFEWLYAPHNNAASKNTSQLLHNVITITIPIQLFEIVCLLCFSKTKWYSEHSKKLRLNSNFAC